MRTRVSRVDKIHREMILHPRRWPKWPFLPLYRTKDGREGVIWAGEMRRDHIVVRNVNLKNLPKYVKDWAKIKGRIYENVEALLADDWEVN